MTPFKTLRSALLILNIGSMTVWTKCLLSTLVLVSVISHGYATSMNSSLSSVPPKATGYKRTTELPVIGMTKTHQVDELESEIALASGDFSWASQFATPIWPSVPVQITASYKREIEHDTITGVVEQHTVMSQGLTYIGANQENSLKTEPFSNITTTALYQTSRSIQPSVDVASLSRSISPTPSYSSRYATHLFTIAASPVTYTESGVESFTLSPIITTSSSTSEVLSTASAPLPRHFQTAQNWRTSLQSDSSLPMPTVDVSTLIWSDTELNTLESNIMALSNTIQPSTDGAYFDGGKVSDSGSLLSIISRTTPPPDSVPTSDLADPATMPPPPTHAHFSSHQTTITPSLKSVPPEWFKEMSTPPETLRGSTEYYQSKTVSNMAPTEPGQVGNDDDNDTDDQSLRPAMTPSPSIIMESSTSYWNWSHRIPINSSNSTMNKDGLSAPNKLLVVSVMVVLGCFAVTALALRIGNRIIKMRKKGNKKSCLAYLRSICPKRNKQPRPKPMKVTVRMTRQTSKKNSVKSISSHQSSIRTIASTTSGQSEKSTTSILRHSKSLANLDNQIHQPSTSTGGLTHYVKRSRTMDALLDIGAFSSDFGPENLLESSSEATLLCKETKSKRTRFLDEVYDNPLMKISMDDSTGETSASFGSQTELQLFMDRPDSKDNLSDCHISPPRSDTNSPICIISHARTDFDTPQDSPLESEKSMENSETESQSDALKKFQLGKCFKWRALQQRCSSKDSGYVTTPTSPCQDGDLGLLPMEGFKLVDETTNDKDVNGIDIPTRRDSIVSSANSSPSSVYPLSSIEESPPPKSRCERCDSLYLASDDSFYSHDNRTRNNPPQRTTWTQNISGLLRDTLANYLYAADRQQYEEGYNSDQCNSDYLYPYPEYPHEIPEYNEDQDNTPPSPSLLKKFFKKRTTEISTQTSGPPLNTRRSSVNWHREDGTYMIRPREDAGMEFMGPIYLAKSVEDFGPFVSGSVMDNDLGNSTV